MKSNLKNLTTASIILFLCIIITSCGTSELDNTAQISVEYYNPADDQGELKYYDSGEVKVVLTVKNGTPDGVFKIYYKNGKILLKSRITENQRDMRGQIEYAYRGEDIYSAEYPQNFDKPIVFKKNNKPLNGKLVIFNGNNEKELFGSRRSILISELNNHDTGELIMTGGNRAVVYFEDGLMVGKLSKFHDNGEKFSEYLFTRGLLNGVFKAWYSGGDLMESGEYQNGKLHGWQRSYSSGRVYREEKFFEGEKIDEIKHD